MDNELTCHYTQTELAESVRSKVTRFLSSGRVLTLAIMFTAGAVMCGFAAISMLLLTGLAFFDSGETVGFDLASVLLASFSYIPAVVIYAHAAAALFKIRASARRGDGCDAVRRLLSLRKCISAFRVFYYISAAFSMAIFLPMTVLNTELTSAGAAVQPSRAYLAGYIVGIIFTTLYVAIGAVWNHIYCSSLIKFIDNIRDRFTEPLSEKPKKCTLAAVLNFINTGVLAAVVGAVITGIVMPVIVIFAGAPFTINSATEPEWLIAGLIIAVTVAVVYFLYAAVLVSVTAPMVTCYILVAVSALKYNKLEKEVTTLVCENKAEDSAVPEGALTE